MLPAEPFFESLFDHCVVVKGQEAHLLVCFVPPVLDSVDEAKVIGNAVMRGGMQIDLFLKRMVGLLMIQADRCVRGQVGCRFSGALASSSRA